MNREDIINCLKTISFPKNKYKIISGASMVMQEIKDNTSDIDISVCDDLYEELCKSSLKYHLGYDDSKVFEMENIEIFKNFYDETDTINIDGYRCADAKSILSLKKIFKRSKDKKDINLLELYICKTDNYFFERELNDKGITLIAGVDEVGRGPLVGPVVAAAVILPACYSLKGLTDSKKLSEKKRNEFDTIIKRDAISYGIGVIDNNIIDEVNIYEATKLAMKDAISKLKVKPEHVLIDAMPLDIDIPTTSIIKGDIKSISVSAASVIAKVYRDNLMYELDKKYPYYNFKSNKGYPTKCHMDAIKKYGIIKEHRKSYSPVSDYINQKNSD